MAVVENTFLTYQAKGIREALSDLISDISPTQTPFISNIGTRSAEQTLFEWQTDSLAAASADAVIEGQDLSTFTAVTNCAYGELLSDQHGGLHHLWY